MVHCSTQMPAGLIMRKKGSFRREGLATNRVPMSITVRISRERFTSTSNLLAQKSAIRIQIKNKSKHVDQQTLDPRGILPTLNNILRTVYILLSDRNPLGAVKENLDEANRKPGNRLDVANNYLVSRDRWGCQRLQVGTAGSISLVKMWLARTLPGRNWRRI